MPSIATARGQERALGTDAEVQLGEVTPTKRIAGLDSQDVRQQVMGAETKQVNRSDTRFASAAHFQR